MNYVEWKIILWLLGINSGLRISYTLNLRIRDVKAKDYISVREKKTGKQKIFQMTPIKREIKNIVMKKI